MAYSEEIKNEVIERLGSGEKAKDISKQLNISVVTIYKWGKERKNKDSANINHMQTTTIVEETIIQSDKSEEMLEKSEESKIQEFSYVEPKPSDRNINNSKETTFKERMKINPEDMIEVVAIEKKKREPNHYNEILKYLEQKRKEIYIKAQSIDYRIQKIGIEQWDKMEILIEKVEENRNNKEYLNNLYNKISELKAIEEGRESR